jgi:non-ribosomal peptide synthase protein (TIGR01720 family)
VPLDFQVADLRSETDPGTAFRRRAVELQTGFCLNRAPLMKAALFRLPDGDRLLWVAHHLIVDAVSWRILFEDLAMVYEQARVGRSAALPEETTTFTAWARSVADHARSDELLKEADAWRRMFAVPVPEFPFAGPSAPADYGAVQTQTCGLTAAETDDLLVRSHAAYTTTTEDLLLAAWTAAVWRERNVADFIVLMEGHGRQAWNGLDIERTVGWFTCTYPVRLIVPGEADLARRIREVKETLRRIPNGGFGYGILHWLAPSELRGAWPTAVRPPISFNYLGRFEENPKAFDLEWPELDGTVSPAAVRPTELDLAVAVRRGNLEATLTYNPVRLPPAQARRLMRCFEAELRVMTTHCVAKRSGEATPADLTYSDLTLEEFDGLFAGSQSGKS